MLGVRLSVQMRFLVSVRVSRPSPSPQSSSPGSRTQRTHKQTSSSVVLVGCWCQNICDDKRSLRRKLKIFSLFIASTIHTLTMWFSSSVLSLLLIAATSYMPSDAFTSSANAATFGARRLSNSISRLEAASGDTPETLPDFESLDKYLEYLATVSALPKGFATGTADGTFISQEAPLMGELKIKGSVIHLTEGPTDNWAAVFTSNMVGVNLIYFYENAQSMEVYDLFCYIHFL